MIQKIIHIYAGKTLHQKIRIAILIFSVFPLICLAGITIPFIYKNQLGKTQKDAIEELQNRANIMSNEMNTIELMGKTVCSDTSFITEVGEAVIDKNFGEYKRYIFKKQTLSAVKVITSVSQVQAARVHLDYQGIRE